MTTIADKVMQLCSLSSFKRPALVLPWTDAYDTADSTSSSNVLRGMVPHAAAVLQENLFHVDKRAMWNIWIMRSDDANCLRCR